MYRLFQKFILILFGDSGANFSIAGLFSNFKVFLQISKSKSCMQNCAGIKTQSKSSHKSNKEIV